MVKIYFKEHEFDITSTLDKVKVKFPDSNYPEMWHNRFKIQVCNGKTNKCIDYKFYDSHHNWENGKKIMNDYDTLNAFSTYLNDNIYGAESFEDFFEDSRYSLTKAKRIWRKLQEEREKGRTIGLDDVLTIELHEHITDDNFKLKQYLE